MPHTSITRAPKHPVERVFSMITTLLAYPKGLTRAEIFEKLGEFYEPDGVAVAVDSKRQMLIRDKNLAVDLGFDVRTRVRKEDVPEDEKHVYLIKGKTDGEELSVELNSTQRGLLVATAGMILDDPAFPMREEMAVAVHKVLMASGGEAGSSGLGDDVACRVELQKGGASVARSGARRWMGPITSAVQERRVVRIDYTDLQGNVTRREIDPWGLAFIWGEWRLAAMCHLRGQVRVFAVHRITSMSGVRRGGRAAKFRLPAKLDVTKIVHVPPWSYSVHEPVRVTLQVEEEFRWWATRYLSVQPDADGYYRMDCTNVEFLVQVALRYGPRVRVVAPVDVVKDVKGRIRAVGSRRGWGKVEKPPRRKKTRQTALARRPQANKRKRLGRFAFLVAYLAKHRRVKLSKLAKVLDVDVNVLVTELEQLATCGVYPTYENELFGIVVTPEEGIVEYTRGPVKAMEQPVALEEREVVALLLGLKWLRDCTTPPFDYEADRIVEKFLGSANRQLKSLIGDVEKRVRIGGRKGPDWDVFLDVSRAVLDRRKVQITYYSMGRDAETKRTVRPYVVVSKLGMWYLSGYCESARKIRTFRFDRIRACRLGGGKFERPASFDPNRYLDWGIYPRPDTPEADRAVVAFDPTWIARNRGREGHEYLDHVVGNQLTFAVDPSAWEGFVSWLMGTTTRFDIEKPAGLKKVQRERKKTLMGVYG